MYQTAKYFSTEFNAKRPDKSNLILMCYPRKTRFDIPGPNSPAKYELITPKARLYDNPVSALTARSGFPNAQT